MASAMVLGNSVALQIPSYSLRNCPVFKYQTPAAQLDAWNGRLSSHKRGSVRSHARHRRRWWSESWEKSPEQPEQIITVFSSNGSITTIPPVPFTSSSSFSPPNTDPDTPTPLRLPTPAEQGLCIGSVFTVTATNGVDVTRRLNVSGFCQSVEILHDTVQRQTMRRGGEIFKVQRELKHGIHETLSIALALPMLWGCPPEHERLRVGIESGGGIIDRIVHEWFIFNE